jgi:hypothetical protein
LGKIKYYIHVHATAGLSTTVCEKAKRNREIILSIQDHNGTIITDTAGKANILNSYYASIFCCDRNITEIKLANWGETFIINIKIIRKMLAEIGRNNSVGPDRIPGKMLDLGGVAMNHFVARTLEISLNNAKIPRDWKIFTADHIYNRDYRSALSNYRPISLTSVVCKQTEHSITGYLRPV